MMNVLLHSSKTMKPEIAAVHELTVPQYATQAAYLHDILSQMSTAQLARVMGIREPLVERVKADIRAWRTSSGGSAAALSFRGDIYSGLAAGRWSTEDARFAQQHLLILSGLYGLLRPFDAIQPYRLEMGYKLAAPTVMPLAAYWQPHLAPLLDPNETYINLTAKEYFQAVTQRLRSATVISPKFLTLSEKTHHPVFVTVHAKIARGSFASWLIRNKLDSPARLHEYSELNYRYDPTLSTASEPVFVCREFGGLGLSVRLK